MYPYGYLAIGGVVVAGGVLAWLWLRNAVTGNDTAFQRVILNDAAGWLSGQLNAPADTIVQALREQIENRAVSPLLQRVLRIDVELTQTNPENCEQSVAVALRGEGDAVVVGKIARPVNWEQLPGEVRREFISTGKKVQSFILMKQGA